MSTSRGLIIALFATIALSTCQQIEDGVVSESVRPISDEEFVQSKDPEDDRLTHLMHGAVVPGPHELVAHKGPADNHDEVTCAEGQVVCASGVCAETCPEFTETDSSTKGYNYEFRPNPNHLEGPPKVAGSATDYA